MRLQYHCIDTGVSLRRYSSISILILQSHNIDTAVLMKRLSKRCFPSIVLQRIDIRCSWVSGSLTRNNYRDCKSRPLNPRITNPRGQKFQSHCSRSTGIASYNDSLTPLGMGHDMLLNTTDTQCLIFCQPYCQPPGIPLGNSDKF